MATWEDVTLPNGGLNTRDAHAVKILEQITKETRIAAAYVRWTRTGEFTVTGGYTDVDQEET